jgi:hypothetical protein
MKPVGLLGPGANSRAMMPAMNPMMTIQGIATVAPLFVPAIGAMPLYRLRLPFWEQLRRNCGFFPAQSLGRR